jgi:2-keto-4-pentenoate hydratase/2-oxohepta-3-ene-1,7-dioic acid hydratase in catechol pathway
MRLATILEDGRASPAIVRDGRVLALPAGDLALASLRAIAAGGQDVLQRVREWADRQPAGSGRSIESVRFGPLIPDPGAIYTIGLNYTTAGADDADRLEPATSERPLVYGKLPTSVVGHGSVVTWDRSLTADVDPEVELGVVIGATALAVSPETAMDHVFGYTCVNDTSSRDPWLDGDQWLLGKSFAGFCPVGPWLVTPDEIEPEGLRLGCTVNGVPIQEDTTAHMRHSVAEVISYLSRHTVLRPGDLIATGTPGRLEGPLGPERHLRPGDRVTVWIERIGELTTTIA